MIMGFGFGALFMSNVVAPVFMALAGALGRGAASLRWLASLRAAASLRGAATSSSSFLASAC